MRDLPRLLKLFPPKFNNIQSRVEATGRAPKIGRGFVYEFEIERKGVGEARYVGLTRRSIFKRRDEHIKGAERLGPLGSAAGGIRHTLSFPEKASPLQVLIRTSIGTVETKPERALKYVKLFERAQPTIIALAEYESYLTKGVTSFNDKKRYDTTFSFTWLNQKKDRGGVDWGKVDDMDRAVASYIYLKEETNKNDVIKYIDEKYKSSNGKFSKQEILIAILYAFYLRRYKYLSPSNAKKAGAMIRYLEDYFSFGESAEVYMSENPKITTGTERNIFLSLIRRMSSVDDKSSVEDFRKKIAPISKETIEVRSNHIYEDFTGIKEHPSKKTAQENVEKGILKYYNESSKRLNEILQENLRKKREENKNKGGK